MYSNISDCDEGAFFPPLASTELNVLIVYNFWEPLHYLDRGYGFQTWETSPAYAIRSWAYIALHLPVVNLLRWIGLDKVCLRHVFTGMTCLIR